MSLLEPCLKEALTNVSRHSQAIKVVVTMDINPHIVRFSIIDNGIGSKNDGAGIGIRNLRQRTQAVGGNISTNSTDKSFSLIYFFITNVAKWKVGDDSGKKLLGWYLSGSLFFIIVFGIILYLVMGR